MGVISGALFWISPILKEKVENENNDVEDPFDDEIRVLPHLRGLAAKEFVVWNLDFFFFFLFSFFFFSLSLIRPLFHLSDHGKFKAKTRQRRKILASHHFFYILFFAFQLFCVSCTVGVTLVIIQPIFVQVIHFSLSFFLFFSFVSYFSIFFFSCSSLMLWVYQPRSPLQHLSIIFLFSSPFLLLQDHSSLLEFF